MTTAPGSPAAAVFGAAVVRAPRTVSAAAVMAKVGPGDGQHLEVPVDGLGAARSDWVRIAKVGEEGGEVVGALIKRDEGRTTTADVITDLGDVILAALGGGLNRLGVDPSTAVAQRWATVCGRAPERSMVAVVEGRR